MKTAPTEKGGIYYYLGATPSHVVHALPLYKRINGTFVVTTKQAKNELETKYKIPVLLIDRTDRLLVKLIYKLSPFTGHKARHLTLGSELKKTFSYLNSAASVVIFYELFEFTASTKLEEPKTVFLTHGNFLKDYFGMFPKRIDMAKDYDYMAALGPETKRRLIQKKYVEPSKLIDIGIARTDEFARVRLLDKKSVNDLKKALGLDVKQRVISYVPTFWGDSSIHSIGLDILRNMTNDFELIFRPHPQTPKNILDKYLEMVEKNKNLYYISESSHKEISLAEILGVSDIIIGDYSSVILESVLLDKPLLFAQNNDRNETDKYTLIDEVYEYSQKITPHNVSNLSEILIKTIDKGIDKKIWEKSKSKLFFNYDGSSAKTIADFISRLC